VRGQIDDGIVARYRSPHRTSVEQIEANRRRAASFQGGPTAFGAADCSYLVTLGKHQGNGTPTDDASCSGYKDAHERRSLQRPAAMMYAAARTSAVITVTQCPPA